MTTLRRLLQLLVLFAAACDDDSDDFDPCFTCGTDAVYALAITVENVDAATYQIWVSPEGASSSSWRLLDVLGPSEGGTWYVDVFPNIPYELLLLAVDGTFLDSSGIPALTVPAEAPVVVSRLALNGELFP